MNELGLTIIAANKLYSLSTYGKSIRIKDQYWPIKVRNIKKLA